MKVLQLRYPDEESTYFMSFWVQCNYFYLVPFQKQGGLRNNLSSFYFPLLPFPFSGPHSLPACLSVCLSAWLPGCLCVCVCVCVCVSLSLSLPLSLSLDFSHLLDLLLLLIYLFFSSLRSSLHSLPIITLMRHMRWCVQTSIEADRQPPAGRYRQTTNYRTENITNWFVIVNKWF